jgi:hypothetical protein
MNIIRRDLDTLKKRGIARVNAVAGEVRKLYVTQIPGQEMLYIAKEAEAKSYLNDPAPDMSNYPLISAEVGKTAPDAVGVAYTYATLAVQWRQIAAALESIRLGAIYAIEEADSVAEINTIIMQLQTAISEMMS